MTENRRNDWYNQSRTMDGSSGAPEWPESPISVFSLLGVFQRIKRAFSYHYWIRM